MYCLKKGLAKKFVQSRSLGEKKSEYKSLCVPDQSLNLCEFFVMQAGKKQTSSTFAGFPSQRPCIYVIRTFVQFKLQVA